MADRGARFAKWLWRQLDPLIALVIALACSVLSLAGVVSGDVLSATILATLTLLALVLIRDREQRDSLETSVRHLEKPISADHFFSCRTQEQTVIVGAVKSLLVLQETGSLVTETYRGEIVASLLRGVQITMVVSSPAGSTSRLLAFRNATLTEPLAIQGRASTFRHLVEDVLRRAGASSGLFRVRYCPYPIGETLVISDPNVPGVVGRAVFRLAGFGIPFEEKPDFQLDSLSSPRTFSIFVEEFQRFYKRSSRVLLVSAPPRTGKTRLFASLVSQIERDEAFFWLLTEAGWSGEERTGFSVRTRNEPQPRPFAERLKDGSYKVDSSVADALAGEIEAAHKGGKVLILDEIGPLQLRSSRFMGIVRKLLDDPCATVFGTIAADGADVEALRKHHRVEVLSAADGVGLDRLGVRLTSELSEAAVLHREMPVGSW